MNIEERIQAAKVEEAKLWEELKAAEAARQPYEDRMCAVRTKWAKMRDSVKTLEAMRDMAAQMEAAQ